MGLMVSCQSAERISGMVGSVRNQSPELGSTPSVTYNRLFLSRIRFSAVRVCLFFASCQGAFAPGFIRTNLRAVLFSDVQDCGLGSILRFQSECLGTAERCSTRSRRLASHLQPQNVITQIRVIGNRRIPRETVLARLFSHQGDAYDPATIERDFNSLWNTGYFENLQIAREDTPKGIILDVIVKEKPTIREINYKGLNSVSTSDVLDRFKKEHVSLSVESPYDPTRLARAIDVIRALLAEHGHQFATVKPDIKTIPPVFGGHQLHRQGRPHGQGGEYHLYREPRGAFARAACGHEKPAAGRSSSLDLPGEHIRPHLRRQQTRGRYRAGSPRAAGSGVFPGRGSRSHHTYPE